MSDVGGVDLPPMEGGLDAPAHNVDYWNGQWAVCCGSDYMHKEVVTTATHLLCNHHTTALQLQFDAWKLIRVDDKVIVMCVCVCSETVFPR